MAVSEAGCVDVCAYDKRQTLHVTCHHHAE